MPKKKTKKTVRPTSRLVEFWRTQRCRHLRGACYILFALFLVIAMISFFISWPSHQNWMGALGFHLSKLIIQNTFGIASFGFALIIFVYGMRLLGRIILPWKRRGNWGGSADKVNDRGRYRCGSGWHLVQRSSRR